MKYAPYYLFMNNDGTDQRWDKMATVSWWWNIQVRYKGLKICKADETR